MIAVLSNEGDATADFLEGHLRSAGAEFVRLNTENMLEWPITWAVGAREPVGTILANGTSIRLSELRAIYYRRPSLPDTSGIADRGLAHWVSSELRQAWGGVLSALPVLWVNHPLAIDRASYKPEQLARAVSAGLQVPESLLTNEPSQAREFCLAMNWRVVAKPVGRGWVRGEDPSDDRVVFTTGLDASQAGQLEQVRCCPTLLQRRIDRDSDVRVTVVGSECFAVDLRLPPERRPETVDCRRDNMRDVEYVRRRLPEALEQGLLRLTASYGLAYAAIDLLRDQSGAYWFLELNPAGQWAWLEEHTGAPIADAIIRALAGSDGERASGKHHDSI